MSDLIERDPGDSPIVVIVLVICCILVALLGFWAWDRIANPMPAAVTIAELKYEMRSTSVAPVFGKGTSFVIHDTGQEFWVRVRWPNYDRGRWVQVSEPMFRSLRVGQQVSSASLSEYMPAEETK